MTAGFVLAGCGGDDKEFNVPNTTTGGGTNTGGTGNLDVDVLNFALNLEYLEAEFYSYAVNGAGIPSGLFTGIGTQGATTGGRKVTFSDSVAAGVAAEIAADEVAHVRFLRTALGGAAVAKPAIDLNALGIGFANEREFFTLARAFEDVGVSAYAGAANLITDKNFLMAAAQILATEAYHAGNVRLQVFQRGIPADAGIPRDQVPATGNLFPTDQNGLAIARSADEVAAIVRGPNPAGGAFFPAGLNGALR